MLFKYLDNPAFFNALLQINEKLSGSDCYYNERSPFNAALKRDRYGSKFDYGSSFTPWLPSASLLPLQSPPIGGMGKNHLSQLPNSPIDSVY